MLYETINSEKNVLSIMTILFSFYRRGSIRVAKPCRMNDINNVNGSEGFKGCLGNTIQIVYKHIDIHVDIYIYIYINI